MKDLKAFLKTKRAASEYRPVCERLKDYKEVSLLRTDERSREQASRCMDCGIPFCHWACPLGNYISEWNDAVLSGRWEKAFELLNATNNFPEITGRVCPAQCEYACVLGINDDPVTIRENELAIIEHAFRNGLVKPQPPKRRTGRKVAVVGSGPSGLAAASQLNRAGHKVVVFEKNDKIGGILRYGIPDFKLEKRIIERRLDLWKKEGIEFKTGVDLGIDLTVPKLLKEFNAACLAIGSGVARDLDIPGRNLPGIYFAMDYLAQSNQRIAGKRISKERLIDAKGKRVVVIGGGDTGSDCVGTANRQGASCVVQIEVMPKPPECRTDQYPWPNYPLLLKRSSSHEEGTERDWAILTKEFIGEGGNLKKLSCVKVKFSQKNGCCPVMQEIRGSNFEIDADMAVLAIGFLHPDHKLLKDSGVKTDKRGNILTDSSLMTNQAGIFSCGDAHRGQSLVVHAIAEGRRAAKFIDRWLMGESNLPVL